MSTAGASGATGSQPRTGQRPREHRRFWLIWLVSFLLATLLGTAWALGTSLFDAPDEPAQVVKAAGVVRGQLIGRPDPSAASAEREFRVPETFAEGYGQLRCYVGKPSVPAGCPPALHPSAQTVTAASYVGRYPPFYFLVVGLPTLFGSGVWTLYAMRIVSAAFSGLYLGLAVATAATWGRSALFALGVGLAATPMALFLAGVVEASGLEVATGIALWACGVALLLHPEPRPPRTLVVLTSFSACSLALVRGLSPFWVALTLVVLAALAGRERLVVLLGQRDVRVGLGVTLLVGALATAWIFATGALDIVPAGNVSTARRLSVVRQVGIMLGTVPSQVHQMVGRFGWFANLAPPITVVLWLVAVGTLVLLATALARRRETAVLFFAIACVVVVPVVIRVATAQRDGLAWQGRYSLPFAVGVPILAAALLPPHAWSRRLLVPLGVLLVVAQAPAYALALARRTIGTTSPLATELDPFTHVVHGWNPPLPAIALDVAYAVLICLWATLLVGIGRSSARRDLDCSRRQTTAPPDQTGSAGLVKGDEPLDRARQAVLEVDLGLPAQEPTGSGDVGATAHRVVGGERGGGDR